MIPIVDGEILKFEPSGLYNGLVLLSDTKTRSFWNHITGECVHGHYKGKSLKIDNLLHTTLESAVEEHREIKIAISKQPIHVKIMNVFIKLQQKRGKSLMPSFFKKTMEKEDNRLDAMDIGLGIWNENKSKFYKYEDIQEQSGVIIDKFDGKNIMVYLDKTSHMPTCKYITGEKYNWRDGDIEILDGEILEEMPMQIYTRWYGFSYTFKDCDIYKF